MSHKFIQNIFGRVWIVVLAFLFPALSARAQSTTNTTRQVLVFRSGDVLFGNLKSISSDKSVVWQRGDALQPIEFSGTNLMEVQFPSARKSVLSAINACRVQLHNGDSLEGKLLQLDSEKVILETLFAGKMVFPRDTVQMLEPLPMERQPVFTGPSGLEGWTMGKVNAVADAGQWRYTNGAFYATQAASIARDVKLPDVASIQFDLAWKGMLQAAFALYTSYMQPINLANKDTEPDFGGFYSLQINSFVSTLMPVRKNEPLKYMGQIAVPAFSQKNHAHIEIRASKPKRTIALLVDGVLIKEWVDAENFAGSGTGMRFVHQGQGAIKLNNLRITEWNGKMELKATNLPPVTEDLAKLLNGDKVSGKLELFSEGKIVFHTSGGKLNIPFERVAELYFPKSDDVSRRTAEPDVRAFFNGGGRLTFRIERWDDQGVVATSATFGRATFLPGTFERAQLHPGISPKPAVEISE